MARQRKFSIEYRRPIPQPYGMATEHTVTENLAIAAKRLGWSLNATAIKLGQSPSSYQYYWGRPRTTPKYKGRRLPDIPVMRELRGFLMGQGMTLEEAAELFEMQREDELAEIRSAVAVLQMTVNGLAKFGEELAATEPPH